MTTSVSAPMSWMRTGTDLFGAAVERLADAQLREPFFALPNWSRAHVIAHVGANADALRNLVTWARTGIETPMYASARQREADIDAGTALPTDELRKHLRSTAAALANDLAALTPGQWAAEVRTAQGRTVPATELSWMRSREVLIHATDLDAGIAFTDLPPDFLATLVDEICVKRSAVTGPALVLQPSDEAAEVRSIAGAGEPIVVHGTLADLAAYLTGRAHAVCRADGRPAPDLPRWALVAI